MPSEGLIPIVVGVTGHRDLPPDQVPVLEGAVGEILGQISARYPSSPLVILSPLAEGADQLVARVGLELPRARLVVPFPMPRDEYEAGMASVSDREEFSRLVSRADQCFTIPESENFRDAGLQPTGKDDLRYALLGKYIVRQSHILIALWDGTPPNNIGGTAQVVQFRLGEIPDDLLTPGECLEPPPSGPLYHVLTPRISNPIPVQDSSRWKCLAGQEGGFLAEIERFNADVAGYCSKPGEQTAQSKEGLLPSAEMVSVSPGLVTIRDIYGFADALAIEFQPKWEGTLRVLCLLALVAILAFEMYSNFNPMQHPLVLAVYPAALAVAWLLFRRAESPRNRWHCRHLDYRALAEGLRVQFYWRLAGLRDAVSASYLRRQWDSVEWVIRALDAVDLMTGPVPVEAGAGDRGLRLAGEHWVQGQSRYFSLCALPREERRGRRHRLLVGAALLAGIVTAFAVIVAGCLAAPGHAPEWANASLNVMLVLGSAAAAVLGLYAEKMAFATLAAQYQRMQALFARGAERLERALALGHQSGARDVLRELGKDALVESGDWVVLRRERPLEPPSGL